MGQIPKKRIGNCVLLTGQITRLYRFTDVSNSKRWENFGLVYEIIRPKSKIITGNPGNNCL